ncbi:class I SAM-dependent methyltransferase [Altererythrobacter sp. TH136]|uniref:class I SAM-dependent methyltransferase n=1 Tax=Altererythrobacter sp. TH136 TaxID=2067415 RepID=UPI001162F5FA|nr:class I SAM-dependent methyltransferase [Altererythrobacter sp. TH136]QDM41304.1 class I SAM-dependent methyltransferase [Altererythrobacter sp. TH136]
MRSLALLLLPMLAAAVPASAQTPPTSTAAAAVAVDPALAAAVADPRRDADRARDQWRKPAETLAFFQVAPDMKVGEYAPGGEWYSRLLGLYLGPKGKLVGLYFDPTSGAFNEKTQAGIREGAAKYPADIAGWSGIPADRFAAMTLEAPAEAEKGTFDRILVMRMMHNLMRWNIADREIKAMRELLKPGGMIGIEQHRAKADAPFSYTDGSKGYLREADVIKFMEINGFELVGTADYNANSRDPANHAGGVWEMKPSWSTKRPELENLGESDRMTLLFRKRA